MLRTALHRARVHSLALLLAAACARGPAPLATPAGAQEPPPPPPATWLPLIGEYGPDSAVRILLEREGALFVRQGAREAKLRAIAGGGWALAGAGGALQPLSILRATDGRVIALASGAFAPGDTVLARRAVGPESGNQLVITPVRPIAELRREAMAASPPAESGSFRAPELVELTTVDPSIHLEIRYATSNNLFGTPFYSQARAFLQRPAAEALGRVSAALRARGYGLLVHDGYRPWYVTKMFWDAAPPEKHGFVADPARGSRHNRGCAVDLSLYDLATGAPVEMPSTYDETTDRAAPDHPGGTSRQRWHRDLLRRAMEAEGFTVNDVEWWHYDYRDWRSYPILNAPFESVRR